MKYVLTSTKLGEYPHLLHHENGICTRDIPWTIGKSKGKNAKIIDAYAKLNDRQLSKRPDLTRIVVRLDIHT